MERGADPANSGANHDKVTPDDAVMIPSSPMADGHAQLLFVSSNGSRFLLR
jgi:hypothetical protein